jgi:tyrosinase
LVQAQSIADKYPTEVAADYRSAAQTLRQPYWDWAVEHILPIAAILPNLTIQGPDGPNTIRNPLYSYRFQKQPAGSGFGGVLSTYPETVRCPVKGSLDNNAALSDINLNLADAGLTGLTVRNFLLFLLFFFALCSLARAAKLNCFASLQKRAFSALEK